MTNPPIGVDPRSPIHLKPELLVENYTVGPAERCDLSSEALRGDDAAHFGELCGADYRSPVPRAML